MRIRCCGGFLSSSSFILRIWTGGCTQHSQPIYLISLHIQYQSCISFLQYVILGLSICTTVSQAVCWYLQLLHFFSLSTIISLLISAVLHCHFWVHHSEQNKKKMARNWYVMIPPLFCISCARIDQDRKSVV